MEFHLSVDTIAKDGKKIPYIVAYSREANLRSKHADYDTGAIALP